MLDYSKFKDYGEYLDYCYEEQYNKVMAARKKEKRMKNRGNKAKRDKGNGRIALTYNIEIPVSHVSFAELLNFIYKRIVKLDAERRYCKYYAPSLEKFKRTEAQINICHKGEDIIEIPPIELGDKYAVLSESVDDIILSRYPDIEENNLKKQIIEKGYKYDEESI